MPIKINGKQFYKVNRITMKTTFKKNILVALMFGTFISYANEGITTISNVKRVKVEFNSVKKGNTLIIKEDNGSILFSENLKTTGNYSRMFDLSALKNGNYTAELNKNFEIIVKPFVVNDGNVSFLTSKETKIIKPIIRNENNRLFISKIDTNKEPVHVTLYYKEELIFSKTFNESKNLNKVFRLAKNEFGNYRVIVNSQNKSYVKEFNI